MTTVETKQVVQLTPEIMAKAFWGMDASEQAKFFDHLGKVIEDECKGDGYSHAYGFGELQWCWLKDTRHGARQQDAHGPVGVRVRLLAAEGQWCAGGDGMSKHTPGPWFVEQDQKTPIYVSPVNRHEQVCICNVCPIDEDDSESGDFLVEEQTRANARLIAAAPDLLEALEGILGKAYKQNWNDAYPDLLEKAEKAIDKARGE